MQLENEISKRLQSEVPKTYEEYYDNMLEIANTIAYEAYHGLVRSDGSTTYDHAIRVRDSVSGDSTNKIVAVLHDVLEDTEWDSEKLLSRGISQTIVEMVEGLTIQDTDSYLTYILRVRKNPIIAKIKKADMRDNLNGCKGNLRNKYLLGLYILTGEIPC